MARRFGIFPEMKFATYQTMDVHMLMALVNTELRNHCGSLDDLCKTHDLDQKALEGRLSAADYHYVAEQNQFR